MKFFRSGLLAVLIILLCGGCAVKPWVKPYERARLAESVMSFSRNPASSAYVHHVRQAREGARGAEGGAGGGCGCN